MNIAIGYTNKDTVSLMLENGSVIYISVSDAHEMVRLVAEAIQRIEGNGRSRILVPGGIVR